MAAASGPAPASRSGTEAASRDNRSAIGGPGSAPPRQLLLERGFDGGAEIAQARDLALRSPLALAREQLLHHLQHQGDRHAQPSPGAGGLPIFGGKQGRSAAQREEPILDGAEVGLVLGRARFRLLD